MDRIVAQPVIQNTTTSVQQNTGYQNGLVGIFSTPTGPLQLTILKQIDEPIKRWIRIQFDIKTSI